MTSAAGIAASANATASEYAKSDSHDPSTLSVIPSSWHKRGSSGLTRPGTHACCASDTSHQVRPMAKIAKVTLVLTDELERWYSVLTSPARSPSDTLHVQH